MKDEEIVRDGARIAHDWAQRGKHWDARADEMASQAENFNAPLIKAGDIQPGQRVLDCATGAGEPALSMARIVGPRGHVTASDLIDAMMAGARRRMREQGLDNISFEHADMCDLPFADAHFDRVICRFGLMFVPNPEVAVREAMRVVKPGGRLAYLVWGPRVENSGFEIVARAAAEVFGPDNPLIDFISPFSLGHDGALETALRSGGCDQVEIEHLRFSPKIPVGTRFWDGQLEMGLGRVMDMANPAQKQALETAILKHAKPDISEDFYHLSVHVKIGTGTRLN